MWGQRYKKENIKPCFRILNMSFKKYKDKLQELYPNLNEDELREILRLRIEFWKIVMKNIK